MDTGYLSSGGQGVMAYGGSSYTWSNPTYVQYDDGVRATLLIVAAGYSNYVTVSNFAFSIPAGAIIRGIQVGIVQEALPVAHVTAKDKAVQLIKADATLGSENKATATEYNPIDTYQYYGGAADLWSEVLTVADVNNANFGVAYSAQGQYCFPAGTLIKTEGDAIPIELIKYGDEVLAFDDNRQIINVKVKSNLQAESPKIVRIKAGDNEIVASTQHPFYNGKEFVTIDSLMVGDTVYILKNGILIPQIVSYTEIIEQETIVYALSVDYPNTYFANGFAVHNKQQLTIYCNYISMKVYYTLQGMKLMGGSIKLIGGRILLTNNPIIET
jgi:hypothetical protein